MAATKAKDEKVITLGKTPQGQVVAETPGMSAPGMSAPGTQREFMGVYGKRLGDPGRHYGWLTSSRSIPNHTKLEMLGDAVVKMCQAYVGSKLVSARRIIECVDDDKRRFFEAMYREWEGEFMLQASMAVALGSCGLIKKFAFQVPVPKEQNAPPVWTATADPLIVKGFDQVYPVGSSPKFDNKNQVFLGMNTPDGEIDRFYTLWLTIGKAWAFGSYYGFGRLRCCYRDWWMKHFGRDLYLVHLQKAIDRIAAVGYPPGQTQDGVDHQEIALGIGDSARTGATIALPSNVWEQEEQVAGETRLTSVKKWTLDFLEGSKATSSFHEIDDHHDSKMALAYLVPPQMFMYVRQSSLGGPTTADVLGDLAEELLLQDAADIDTHVNKYVFPMIDKANFMPGSPPVRVRTLTLEPGAKSELKEVVMELFKRADIQPAEFIDLRESVNRLGWPKPQPLVAPERDGMPDDFPDDDDDGEPGGGDDEDQNVPPDDEEEAMAKKPQGKAQAVVAAGVEIDDAERARLETIVNAALPPVPTGIDLIGEADITQAMRRLQDVLPELFE